MFLPRGLHPADGGLGPRRTPASFLAKGGEPGLTSAELGPEMLYCVAKRSGRNRGETVQMTGLQGDNIVQGLDLSELK